MTFQRPLWDIPDSKSAAMQKRRERGRCQGDVKATMTPYGIDALISKTGSTIWKQLFSTGCSLDVIVTLNACALPSKSDTAQDKVPGEEPSRIPSEKRTQGQNTQPKFRFELK